MKDREALVAALQERYADAEEACFLMTYSGVGLSWPPPEGRRISTLARCVTELSISWVNRSYRNIYAVPAHASPVGWTLADLTGSPVAAARVLQDFYEAGGEADVQMLRPRLDGRLMALRGRYRALRIDGRIVGHLGIEEDVTCELVRPPDPAWN